MDFSSQLLEEQTSLDGVPLLVLKGETSTPIKTDCLLIRHNQPRMKRITLVSFYRQLTKTKQYVIEKVLCLNKRTLDSWV